jgi:hypothetical protein
MEDSNHGFFYWHRVCVTVFIFGVFKMKVVCRRYITLGNSRVVTIPKELQKLQGRKGTVYIAVLELHEVEQIERSLQCLKMT